MKFKQTHYPSAKRNRLSITAKLSLMESASENLDSALLTHKGGDFRSAPLFFSPNDLEANERAERYAKIVMRPVGEIDFIANVQTQSDRAQVTFQASTRVQNATDIIGT